MELIPWDVRKDIRNYLLEMVNNNRQPSGAELLVEIEKSLGWKVRWDLCQVIEDIVDDKTLSNIIKDYFMEMVDPYSENSIIYALGGQDTDNKVCLLQNKSTEVCEEFVQNLTA